jgi:uncharacterized protein (TIGR00251 family)
MKRPRSAGSSGQAASCAGVAEARAKAGTRAELKDFVRPTESGVYVKLRASPGAKRTEIKGLYGEGAIKLCVAAPPAEGKANAEIERYLGRLFELSRSGVSVTKGAQSRDKVVFVRGLNVDELRARLNDFL